MTVNFHTAVRERSELYPIRVALTLGVSFSFTVMVWLSQSLLQSAVCNPGGYGRQGLLDSREPEWAPWQSFHCRDAEYSSQEIFLLCDLLLPKSHQRYNLLSEFHFPWELERNCAQWGSEFCHRNLKELNMRGWYPSTSS